MPIDRRRTLVIRIFRLAGVLVVVLPQAAIAHTSADANHLASGFLHPITGLDHALMMLAVGLFAASLGRRAVFLFPACFVLMMAIGAGLGYRGIALPYVEGGIAASVAIAGALIVWRPMRRAAAAGALLACFAVLHGHVHGAEMAATSDAVAYGAGFMLATMVLHAAGIAAAQVGRRYAPRIVRASGAAIALAGCTMLAAGF
jgi:urease accessory protein